MRKLSALLLIPIMVSGCWKMTDNSANGRGMATQNNGVHYETITKVIDGDTFYIAADWSPYKLQWKIRLLGLDTPEKGYRAHCQRERDLSGKAQTLTEQLVRSSGMRVRLQDVKHDKFGGRLDATVILSDESTLQQHLLKSGLARRYNGDGPRPNWCRA